jgi:hypothetical protein
LISLWKKWTIVHLTLTNNNSRIHQAYRFCLCSYHFSIIFYNCSDSMIFLVLHLFIAITTNWTSDYIGCDDFYWTIQSNIRLPINPFLINYRIKLNIRFAISFFLINNSVKLNIRLAISSFRISICTTLSDEICQWLATGRWFSPSTQVSSINKTDRHDITEILLKVALNTIKQTNKHRSLVYVFIERQQLSSLQSFKNKFRSLY